MLQLKAAQIEWNYNWKKLNENKSLPSLTLEDDNNNNNKGQPRSSRHQRILKKHVIDLEKNTKSLKRNNEELNRRILKLEEEIKILQGKGEDDNNRLERISGNEIGDYIKMHRINEIGNNKVPNYEERLTKVEIAQKISADSVFNLSRQLSNFDKLHMSMLELLENVESIENKVDKNFPEFRKEISKLEIQMAEATSQVALLKEDQTNTRKSVKAIGVSVSNLKDKLDSDHSQLEELNDDVENLQKSSSVQTSKLHDHILKVRQKNLISNLIIPISNRVNFY